MNRWFNWGAFLSAMIMLTLLYFFEIQPRDKTIARLEAERDSLILAGATTKLDTPWQQWRIAVRDENADAARLYKQLVFDEVMRSGWPPDTLKHKPMKRREN